MKTIQVTDEVYEKILKSFCANDSKAREWMREPFSINERTYATDSYLMVSVESYLTGKEFIGNCEDSKKMICESNMCVEPNIIGLMIEVDELNELLKKSTEDESLLKGKKTECLECDGYGTVTWEYNGHDKQDNCPVCEGDGVLSIAKARKEGMTCSEQHLHIDFGDSRYSTFNIKRLIDVANLLQENEIYLIHQTTANKAGLFTVGKCRILVMPIFQKKSDVVIKKYDL